MNNKTQFKIIEIIFFLTIIGLLALEFAPSAQAVNSIGLPVDPNYANKTYSVQIVDLSPSSGQTDFLTIVAPNDKLVRINRIQITADANATGAVDFYVYKQTGFDSVASYATQQIPVQHDSLYPTPILHSSSGFVIGQSYQIQSPSTGCTNMGAATNTVGLNFIATSTSPSSGTCIANESAHSLVYSFSNSPVSLGSNRFVIRGDHYIVPNSGTAGYPSPVWLEDFGVRNDQMIVLRPGESLAIGLAGNWTNTPASVSLYALISWTEE